MVSGPHSFERKQSCSIVANFHLEKQTTTTNNQNKKFTASVTYLFDVANSMLVKINFTSHAISSSSDRSYDVNHFNNIFWKITIINMASRKKETIRRTQKYHFASI